MDKRSKRVQPIRLSPKFFPLDIHKSMFINDLMITIPQYYAESWGESIWSKHNNKNCKWNIEIEYESPKELGKIKQNTAPKPIPIFSNVDASTLTEIKFDYYEFDAGEVPSGPDIEFKFPFTNIGEIPLVIKYCKSSSGSVIPICKDRFILPGESSIFEARHKTKGVTGLTGKTLTMGANTDPEITMLHLKANIVAEERND